MNEEVKHGATNKFYHHRMPMEIDKQPAVLMNRDTLYSFAIIDASHDATVHVPEGDGRYISLHVMDHDHTTEHVYYGAGDYKIDPDKATHFLVLNIRTQVNPNDPADIQKAHVIQDEYKVTFPDGYTPKAFKMIDWNTDELKKLQAHYCQLADKRGVSKTSGPRGDYPQEDVNIGGWGGLPAKHAFDWVVAPADEGAKNAQCSSTTIRPLPVQYDKNGYWSLTVYNAEGWVKSEICTYLEL